MTKLIIPSYKKFLPLLHSFVALSSEVFEISEILEKVELCTEEAFIYLLNNSYRDEAGEIEISISIDETDFILSFLDRGLPIDIVLPDTFTVVDDPGSIETEKLELLLINRFSDRAEWLNHGKQGQEFRLFFELPHQAVYTLPKTEDEPFKIDPADIEIRRFEACWALNISQIIYRAYGYSYPNEDLYYPERITALNRSGKLVSVVAYDKKHDRIAGHYALEREDLGSIAEIGQAVVSPQYRGLGLMEKIRLKTQEVGRELGLEGIMSKPVTVHLFSQKVNESLGAVPVGMGFGVSPVKKFKQLEVDTMERGSCFYYFLPLKNRKRILHIPQKHRNVITEIYDDLGLDYTLDTGTTPPVERGEVRSTYSNDFEIGSIYVSKIGRDNADSIKEAFFNLLLRMKAKVILLFITIEDADIEPLLSLIEQEKLFFSGILPSALDSKDVVIYEFLPETIDESKIKIFSERAKQLAKYVSQEMGSVQ